MKNIITIVFCLLISKSYSQEINEKVIKSDIKEVTVFLKGAQITRKKLLN